MNTNRNQELMLQSHPSQLITQISPETRDLFTLGEQKGWNFNLLGQAQLPKEPVHLESWLIVPANQDSSEILNRSYKKIQMLFANGIRPKGFVVVHEAPKLLRASKVIPPQPSREPFPPEIERLQQLTNPMDGVASIVSSVLQGSLMIILSTLFMGIAIIDPIIVAVMEDGCWVEIDRWSTKV